MLFISSLTADALTTKIKNLVGEKQYYKHKNLVDTLFQKKSNFYTVKGNLRYEDILKVLRNNGLLHLKFKKPKEVKIEFTTNENPIKSLKILNDTLRDMGYYYYFTKSNMFNKDQQAMVWTIVFNAEYAVDPLLFTQELKKRHCYVMDIDKQSSNFWKYSLDMEFANIKDITRISKNEKVVLHKPLKPYFIEVDYAISVEIISTRLNRWFPYIVCFDKDLNVLKVIKEKNVHKKYKINLPKNTKYIKIADLYNLINIKRGLSVIVR